MARWHICNVWEESGNRHLWQFSPAAGACKLERQLTCLPSETFPARLYAKGWNAMWQTRLNVAWLPPHQVFLRVLHLPETDATETHSMVEFQLEKLSPLPVAQIVWSMVKLPQHAPGEQSLVVMIAERTAVEGFLGQLEGKGYFTDRIEVPMLDLLLATEAKEDGVWVYPVALASKKTWLTAWWFGGVLRHLGLVTLPEAEEQEGLLKSQLLQIVWAGEMEGWLSAAFSWHLVTGPAETILWEKVIRDISGAPANLLPPMPPEQLAGLTAKRLAEPAENSNLLPADYGARYKQQFIDRLWMSGLGAAVLVYLAGVFIYMGALSALKFQTSHTEKQLADMSGVFTNALEMKAEIGVLQQQITLKNAVLDGWLSTVEVLPEDLSFNSLTVSRGRLFTLQGTAPQDQNAEVNNYNKDLRQQRDEQAGSLMFTNVTVPHMDVRNNNLVTWSFTCELNRGEAE